MTKLFALLHSEVVGIYSGLNSILAALVVLHAFTLTPDQIAAVIVIGNVILGPIVRGLVTPTTVRKPATVDTPNVQGSAYVGVLLPLVLLVALIGAGSAYASANHGARPQVTSPCSRPHVLFCDDFSSTTLDTSKWVTNWLGGPGPVNSSESACYDSAHVSVSNGALNLALTDQSSTCKGATRPETTGIVTTNKSFWTPTTNYRVTVRAYIPPAGALMANWVAIWTDGQSWPTDGESDIVESLSGHACWHYHSPSGGPGGCVGALTGWHTFREDVVGSTTTYRYDKTVVGHETNVQQPHYLVIGNQGSGPYGGPSKPAVMRVKYALVQSL